MLTMYEPYVSVPASVEHAQHVHPLHLLTGCHTPGALDTLVQIQFDCGRALHTGKGRARAGGSTQTTNLCKLFVELMQSHIWDTCYT